MEEEWSNIALVFNGVWAFFSHRENLFPQRGRIAL
jgi:hypothetical protein